MSYSASDNGIQATLEISLWLSKFVNIDLSYGGYYQVVPTVKLDDSIPSSCEVISLQSRSDQHMQRPCALRNQNQATGQIFCLTRSNQVISLDDIFTYRVFSLLDVNNIRQQLAQCDIIIKLEVFYITEAGLNAKHDDEHESHCEASCETNASSSSLANQARKVTKKRLCSRTLKLHFKDGSLFEHRCVIFGSGCCLCQVDCGIFGAVISLSEPYQKFTKMESSRQGWRQREVSERVNIESQATFQKILSTGMQANASYASTLMTTKESIIKLLYCLLVSYESLQATYVEMQNVLVQLNCEHRTNGYKACDAAVKALETNFEQRDCVNQYAKLREQLDLLDPDIDAYIEFAKFNISRQSGENLQLWELLCHRFIANNRIRSYLTKRFRREQKTRLEEAIFLLDHPQQSLLDTTESTRVLVRHNNVWELIKNSQYYTTLPCLPLECVENDGKPLHVPVIFADRYIALPLVVEREPSSSGSGEGGSKNKPKLRTVESEPALHAPSVNDCLDLERTKVIEMSPASSPDDDTPDGTNPSLSSKNNCSFWDVILSKNEETREKVNVTPKLIARPLRLIDPLTVGGIFDSARSDFRNAYVQKFNGLLWCDHPMRTHDQLTENLKLHRCEKKSEDSVHLIVCVHGLEGSSEDMKLVKIFLEQALPQHKLDFLICDSVEGEYTYEDLETLSQELVSEIITHIIRMPSSPERISFIGHSMGAVLVRAAIANDVFSEYLPRLYTFLSLSGPHLGLLANPSKLVYTGLLLLQRWKKSKSLSQLAMKDEQDLRKTYLYRLCGNSKLHYFKNVLLAASGQDYYAPYYSARIELSESGDKAHPNSTAAVLNEMVMKIMKPVVDVGEEKFENAVNLIRYDVRLDQQGNVADSITGRLNHIAFIDSEVFLDKFFSIHAWEYFQ